MPDNTIPNPPGNGNETPSPEIQYTWKGNWAVNIPIFFALAGFLIGILILNGKGCNTSARYHDLCLENKRAIVDSIQRIRITLLNKKLESLIDRRKKIRPVPEPATRNLTTATQTTRAQKPDSAQLYGDSIKVVKDYLADLHGSLDSLNYLNVDTSMAFFKQYFSIDRDSIRNSLIDPDNKGFKASADSGILVKIYQRFPLLDTGLLDTMRLKVGSCGQENKVSGLMDFFSRNSAFGLWFFLALAQIMMWFILIPILVGIARSTNNIMEVFPYNLKNGFLMTIIPLLVILLFVILVYNQIIDVQIIGDQYFLDGFSGRLTWYAFFGYGVTVLCFGVYLFLANKLQLLNEFSRGARLSEDQALQEKYLALRKAFDLAFLISAIILSIFVLWMGVMFSAINDLEIFRFYRELSGKNFFDNNLVYLNGLLHSVLLLVFYVPVRLQFNQLRLTKEQKDYEDERDSNTKKIFKSFWEGISAILLTTSPLIASLIEKLLSSLGD
ncbi:hypothetical protein LZZ85_20900 [Terrimonas sp. NA20]|uniref:Uncharacterized protein n=1 Tax=Terrimonas ginsenosidimutans TaxID=2908004 RepID=A0ABS9KWS8_9BACT|nr:hypothetical protein [Terrimonas ginsenosidimutans]MCG2616771.1 hypothetical protein [Terrimonas ginsenosidimutans]